jgi:hypothetical protein
MASSLGGGSTFDPITGQVTASLTVDGATYNNVQDALVGVSSTASAGWDVATAAVGSGTVTNTGASANVGPGGNATYVAGNNIAIAQNGTEVQFALADDIALNSVTANNVTTNTLQVVGGPTIDSTGITLVEGNMIDMSGGQIHNLGDGTEPGDAVNLSQLNNGLTNVLNQANSYTDQAFNSLNFDLREATRDGRGGTAAALAMGQVPQAFEPGMGIGGMGVSTWQGEQAIAFGFSKASDNGRIVIRAAGSVNTRGHGGAAAGVGFQF